MTYNDLASAVEDLKEKGVSNIYSDPEFGSNLQEQREFVKSLEIETTYRFDRGTNPADDSTLYVVKKADGTLRYIIHTMGTQADRDKSKLIDLLMKSQSKT
ncbi:MAG: hypothetical protein WDZ29_06185 [Balneolaceae bacterium]